MKVIFQFAARTRTKEKTHYILERVVQCLQCGRFPSTLGANIASYGITGMSSGSAAKKRGRGAE